MCLWAVHTTTLLILLLGCIEGSAAAATAPPPRDAYYALVSVPSKLYGLIQKKGVLPTYKYDRVAFDKRPFKTWLRDATMLMPSASNTVQPPMASRCGVYVNHAYKFILLRNKEAGFGAILTALGSAGLCSEAEAAPLTAGCLVHMHAEQEFMEGRDPDALWTNYLVISSSRNPWARAAAAFEYVHKSWHQQEGACTQPPFTDFCQDPMLLGKISTLYDCKRNGTVSNKGQQYVPMSEDDWEHDFSHVEPAAHCFTSVLGEPVVDFLIRYENLHEDVGKALDLINSRRPSEMPAITKGSGVAPHGSTAHRLDGQEEAGGVSPLADRFRKCGRLCVDHVARFYQGDLEFFGWSTPEDL